MRLSLALFLVSLLCISAAAADEVFVDYELAPPSFPQIVQNEGHGILSIELVDYDTRECISDIHIQMSIKNKQTGELTKTLRYLPIGNISIDNAEGDWIISLLADDLDTDGKDYVGTLSLSVENESLDQKIEVLMTPVGSVRGTVVDSSGNSVVGAKLKFECSSSWGELEEKATDDFGAFSSMWLPKGTCKISSLYSDTVGWTSVEVEHGKTKEITIELKGKTIREGYTVWHLILPIALILTLVIAAGFFIMAKRQRTDTSEKGPVELSPGMQAIVETISSEQQPIIYELAKAGGKMRQADLVFHTALSKASVSRYVSFLEQRKILESKRLGSLKEVRLSDWFLSQ